jgi:PAS domain S-box-containing protein
MTVQFALIAAIPMAVMCALYFAWIKPLAKNEAEALQSLHTRFIASLIEEHLTSFSRELDAVARRIEAVPESHTQSLNGVLDAHVGNGDAFETIALTDESGQTIAIGLPPARRAQRPSYLGVDVSQRAFFKDVRARGAPIWSGTYLSATTGGMTVSHVRPFKNRILIGEISLARMSGFLKLFAANGGANLESMLIDRQGILVSHSDPQFTGQQISLLNIDIVRGALDGREGMSDLSFEGKPVLASIAPVQSIGWAVLTTQPRAIAFRALDRQGESYAIAVVSALLAAAIGGILLAKSFDRRVHRYSSAMGEIAAGNHAIEWPRSRVREIEALRDNVAQMVSAIEEREKRIDAAQTRFRAAFLHSPLPMAISRLADGRFIEVSDAWDRVYGYSREETIGRTGTELGIWKESERRDAFLAGTAKGSLRNFPVVMIHKNGAEMEMMVHSERVEIDGEACALSTAVDVTAQNKALRSLNESESRFRIMIETMSEGVVLHGPDYGVVMCNRAALEILGVSERQLLNWEMDPGWRIEDDRGNIVSTDEFPALKVINTGQPVLKYQLVIVRADGSRRAISVNAVPFEATSLGGRSALVTFSDITVAIQANNKLRELAAVLESRVATRTAELAQANTELEAFAYSVSHDLRAPLRAIEGFASLLESRAQDTLDDDSKGYIARIRSGAQRMGMIIADLLTLARVSRLEMKDATVNLADMAREIADELSHSDPDRQVEWRIADQATVRGDPGLLRILLENLLGNAWKYTGRTPSGVIEFFVAAESSEAIELGVRDNGAGFDNAYASQLFLPFKRLHSDREFPGSGIGLATVRRIVQRHGGDVRAIGEIGKGATFWFSLRKIRESS